MQGLVADCHQTYTLSVAAENAAGVGTPVKAAPFRPSGIITPGTEPPYVVILLDGIKEAQPGFSMDPYKPTLDQTEPQGYCPESWNPTKKKYGEADFRGAPDGPWSFFHKWNYGEVDSNGNQTGNHESEPRALEFNTNNLRPGTYTHSFMLDAVAANEAIILPYSYEGIGLIKGGEPNGDPLFSFEGYTEEQSTPGDPEAPSLEEDAARLAYEVTTVEETWPSADIIVVGHSQGGLIAWKWYHEDRGALDSRVVGFSLDSPINGVCVTLLCGSIPGYPEWNKRETFDQQWLTFDASEGWGFRFIGTYGDEVRINLPIGHLDSYGSGAETLEHQLPFPYSSSLHEAEVRSLCGNPLQEDTCPASAPPDHISEHCEIVEHLVPAWEEREGHYVVKYCPSNVAYFNSVLGLAY